MNNPVSIAKTEASMCRGVILVNRTNVGRKLKAKDMVSPIALVSTTNRISLIPISRFKRKTKKRFKAQPMTLQS